MSLVQDLQWRYATKKMNGNTVPQEKLDYILDAARLAPSSSGIQPYRILVISNRELLQELRAASFDQSQITDCSHLLVWAAWDGYTKESITSVLVYAAEERGMPEAAATDYADKLWGMLGAKPQEWHAQHAAKQAYISLGMALAAAAEQQVDATPMEGFENAKYDAILGLEEKGLKSAVILPIGYRDAENDWLVNHKKVRTPKADFIIEIA